MPELWSAVRERYAEHVRDARRVKREAFAGEVYQALVELHRQGTYPAVRFAAIPQPQYRSRELVAEIMRGVRHELSIDPYRPYRG